MLYFITLCMFLDRKSQKYLLLLLLHCELISGSKKWPQYKLINSCWLSLFCMGCLWGWHHVWATIRKMPPPTWNTVEFFLYSQDDKFLVQNRFWRVCSEITATVNQSIYSQTDATVEDGDWEAAEFHRSDSAFREVNVSLYLDTHHKPLQELPGTLQIHVGYVHVISHHALLWGGDVLVELLSSVVELLLSFDVLTGDRKQFHCSDADGQKDNRWRQVWSY